MHVGVENCRKGKSSESYKTGRDNESTRTVKFRTTPPPPPHSLKQTEEKCGGGWGFTHMHVHTHLRHVCAHNFHSKWRVSIYPKINFLYAPCMHGFYSIPVMGARAPVWHLAPSFTILVYTCTTDSHGKRMQNKYPRKDI